MRDHGKSTMLYPNVLGQSGTARAAPVFVTSPPRRMSTHVAVRVASARRYATSSRPRSVPPRSGPHRRRVLWQEVLLGLRRAVLVGAPIDRRQRRAPVQVRG